MPIYEYACEKCNKHFEIMQKITDESLTTCSDCNGRLRKMISSTSFVLKGTGWYATDYASNKGSVPKTTAPQKSKDSIKTSATEETKTGPKETSTEKKEPAATVK